MILFNLHASEPFSRLLFGSGLLFLTVLTHSTELSLSLLALSALLIQILDGHGLTNVRILKLLRWFVVPIILLHTLFSPGQLLWPEFFIPMSREGLMQGVMLSLHLSAIFFVAILMFRLLKRDEWLRYVIVFPRLGNQLVIYVWMMGCMKHHTVSLLATLRLQFRLRRDFKSVPLLLMSAFKQSLADASEYAAMLWLRWPTQITVNISEYDAERVSLVRYYSLSLSLAGVGSLAFLWIWL